MLSHTFFLREHLQSGWAAGSAGRVGEPETPDSPKESFQLTLPLSGAEWQGAFQWLQQACQPVGLKGGWRDCCIVNAPERSGLGPLDC